MSCWLLLKAVFMHDFKEIESTEATTVDAKISEENKTVDRSLKWFIAKVSQSKEDGWL